MRVLLVDVDCVIPNLALMHLSAYHRAKGDEVGFHIKNPEIVYISCVFGRNGPQALGIKSLYPEAKVFVGGSGVDLYTRLANEVEHCMPDYSLYNSDFSMGFTSRGCIRKCPWCIVPVKEGPIHDHAPISEFLHPNHKKLILLDDNFLASPKWHENLEYIIEKRLCVNFNQGLDIRFVTEENAKLLTKVHFYNMRFLSRRLHFAFDDPSLEQVVRSGVKTLAEAGIPRRGLMFYILCGFSTIHEEDMHRYQVLYDLGVDAYVMKYNDRTDDEWLNRFDRWVNYLHGSRTCRFEDYNKRVKWQELFQEKLACED